MPMGSLSYLPFIRPVLTSLNLNKGAPLIGDVFTTNTVLPKSKALFLFFLKSYFRNPGLK
ncbi:hypothetical protein SAMN05444162_1947 [Paenibacillaceae bacterium GAS479]|nr:hypothetical protein SAMN05444162_1947 [Paenibacillaceae bacterium GAS479]